MILLHAQDNAKLAFGEEFVKTELAQKYNLTQADVEGMIVTDNYVTKHNGVRHIYYQQTYNGVPILHAHSNLNITKENKVPFFRSSFYPNVESLIDGANPKLTPEDAIISSVQDLQLVMTKKSDLVEAVSKNHFVFQNEVSRKPIQVKLMYVEGEDERLKLAWDVEIGPQESLDYWSMRIDASNGAIIEKYNNTLYCNVDHTKARTAHHAGCNHKHGNVAKAESSAPMASGSYKAYILPTESPIHGDQSVITQPHDAEASPFGWHDINGMDGADFTVTRGNNVHAYLDDDGDGFSDGAEPSGGDDLIFDFEHLVDADADRSYNAGVVNLFYSINAMHDLLYRFGFDEAAGNYQFNNYGNGGIENDPIIAREAAPGAANNATWLPTGDGLSGEMNMGVWTANDGVLFVNEPVELQGAIENAAPTDDTGWGLIWGVTQVDVTGDVVLARDASFQNPTTCCNPIVNEDEVNGNIALIDRGLCEFGTKSLNAQNAGAVAVIICNVVGASGGGTGEELINMGAGDDGVMVTIPSIFATKSSCDRIRVAIENGTTVNIHITNTASSSGPADFSSSFDNGVIAHEMGHGVNGRLVGGPGNPAGLSNAEQMGEGWSDLFSVAFTIEEGDTGEDPRGVGTYVLEQAPDGIGIRLYPYSRDINLSPYTYDDIIGQNEVHAIGEIWAAMLWDVMWNFIDTYGFDPEWRDTESGNYKALLLFMDGFKIVGARPGFEDARDAIIAADDINNGGENFCLLWDTFARRGLGVNADQGDPDDSNDGVEGFQSHPACQTEFVINKTVTDFIQPGDVIDVNIFVGNYTGVVAPNTVVTDIIDSDLSYVDGSANIEPSFSGDEISFDLGDMDVLAEQTISYQLQSDPGKFSAQVLLDDIETVGPEWTVDFLSADGFNLWAVTQLASSSDFSSWYVEAVDDGSQQTLIYNNLDVSGEKPALRFWHQINTTSTIDGGFVEISNDGGLTWERVDDKFIRNGYSLPLNYGTFAIPSLNAFSGNSNGFVDSYIDLSSFAGTTISIRFRFATDDVNTTPVPAVLPGWFVDDFELMDLLVYESSACVSADDLDTECTTGIKTVVDSDQLSSADESNVVGFELDMYPNPADDQVTLELETEISGDYILGLTSLEGRNLFKKTIPIRDAKEFIQIDLSSVLPGMYIVSLETEGGVITRKLIVE